MTPKLKPVHVKRGTKIVEFNPIREYTGFGRRGHVFKQQGGNWFTATGRHIPESEVPEKVRDLSARAGLKKKHSGTRVAEECGHCGETFYADELRDHLLDVWKQTTAAQSPTPELSQRSPLASPIAFPADADVPPSVSALG